MFSKASEYGIKALIYIARQSSQKGFVKLKEIAEATNSPAAFSAKILHQLAKEGIVASSSGPHGGFRMDAEHQSKVTLSQVIHKLDENFLLDKCVLGLAVCDNTNPCPLHNDIAGVKHNLSNILSQTTIKDLVSKVESEESFLKVG